MKRKALLFCLAVLSVDLHGQQIGEIDLVRHKPDAAEKQTVDVGLDGCDFPHHTNSDGVIVNSNGRSKLKVKLMLSKQTFERGEIMDGQVQMQNVGLDVVVIPWSSDPHVSKRPSDAVEHEYEIGWFELEWRGGGKVGVPLESESESNFLYSSGSNSESRLRMEPGQWVIAKFKFRLEKKQKLSVLLPLETGKAEISVHWRQARYTWQREGCAVGTGYFNYNYEEDAKPVSIEIVK